MEKGRDCQGCCGMKQDGAWVYLCEYRECPAHPYNLSTEHNLYRQGLS